MESSCLPATLDSLTHASEANTPSEAIYILYRILENPSSSSEALRIKELAIFKLCDLLSQEKWAEDLKNLPIQLRPFFSLIPKAKTAKIVKELLMQWLKYRYSEASTLLSRLIKEVRRLDDKLLLIEIDLLESKLHFSLKNLPKAKAALTAARTAASAFYIPTDRQGEIDLQSGILHAQEKGYKVAYSYFYEAFETFNAFSRDPKDTSSKKDPDAKAKAKAI
ncbi:26S proteasome non-ATPase regulatory subunit 11 -like protein [Capsicum annuum]|uniref:26S proteasome non-ATPase regulatory subunit 11 -like protein n=1 Tax=Capsicum annuum TaxID=4072 RepID=A0A2G2YDD2_CAPAN|nr:26S proteasome non-ATPase regulatory subunit 11 -like protein [Capsicum annuum]